MNKFYHYFRWITCVIFHVIPVVFILQVEVEANAELGSIECVDGKWKVDTRLMALVMTCPLPLDGNADSVMKMAKCAMNKLGIYDGEDLSPDFTSTLCSLFGEKDVQKKCVKHSDMCASVSFVRVNWEILWPAFATCFLPFVMGHKTGLYFRPPSKILKSESICGQPIYIPHWQGPPHPLNKS